MVTLSTKPRKFSKAFPVTIRRKKRILPASLPDGKIAGLCARGGFELTLEWKQGKLTNIQILSKTGNTCKVRYGDKVVAFATVKGKVYRLAAELQ